MSPASPNSSTDLDRALVALLADVKTAEDTANALDPEDAFDIGVELYEARCALQKARDLLDRLPAFSASDAEPRSYTHAGHTIHHYAPPADVIARQRAAQAAMDELYA